MVMWDWLREAKASPQHDAGDGEGFFNTIHIPSRDFVGLCARSPNKRFTLAWVDGGPDGARIGRYLLLDGKTVVAEGKMARPNDGKVADNGTFVLNDWGSLEALSGTFRACAPDG